MRDLFRLHTPHLKRSWSPDSSENGAGDIRKRSKTNTAEDEANTGETIFIDSDDERPMVVRGAGNAEDPIQLYQWRTEKLIPEDDHGKTFDLVDVDDEPAALDVFGFGYQEVIADDDDGMSFHIWDSDDDLELGTTQRMEEKESGGIDNLLDIDSWWDNEDLIPSHDNGKTFDISDDESEPEDLDLEAKPKLRSEQCSVGSAFRPGSRRMSGFGFGSGRRDALAYLEQELVEEDVPGLTSSQETLDFDDGEDGSASEYTALPTTLDSVDKVIRPLVAAQPLTLKDIRRQDSDDPESAQFRKDFKRYFFEVYARNKRRRLEQQVIKYISHISTRRHPDECWLHPAPPHPRNVLSPSFSIPFRGEWRTYSFNIVLVQQYLSDTLTDAQKEGIINHSWHASHLCGNWTCMNPRHVIAEPGGINQNRKPCFRDIHGPCLHSPKCLKYLKIDVTLLRPKVQATIQSI